MINKDEYIRTMQSQLDKWNYEIVTMSAKADKVKGEALSGYNEQIVLLVAMQAQAREKIKKLQEADESLWEAMKPDIDHAWDDMEKLINSAKHHFRFFEHHQEETYAKAQEHSCCQQNESGQRQSH